MTSGATESDVEFRSDMTVELVRAAARDADVPSFPQREIEMCAEAMERHWSELMPATHAAFNANGRIAP